MKGRSNVGNGQVTAILWMLCGQIDLVVSLIISRISHLVSESSLYWYSEVNFIESVAVLWKMPKGWLFGQDVSLEEYGEV
jgi:hypothetical protein